MANSDLLMCSPSPSQVSSNHVSKLMITSMMGMIGPPIVSPADSGSDHQTHCEHTNCGVVSSNHSSDYYASRECNYNDDRDDQDSISDDLTECSSPRKGNKFASHVGKSISNFADSVSQFSNEHDDFENDDDDDSLGEMNFVMNDHRIQSFHESFLGDSASDFDRHHRSMNSSRDSLFSFDFEDDGFDDDDDDDDDDKSLGRSDDDEDEHKEDDAFDANERIVMLPMNMSFALLPQDDFDLNASRMSFDDVSSVMSSNDRSVATTGTNKSVRFGCAIVREYSVTVGSHSATSSDSCPIQLSWEYAAGKEKIIDLRRHGRFGNTSSDDDSCNSRTTLLSSSRGPRSPRRCRKKDLLREAKEEMKGHQPPSRLTLEERRQYIAKIRGITIDEVLQLEKEVAVTVQQQQEPELNYCEAESNDEIQ